MDCQLRDLKEYNNKSLDKLTTKIYPKTPEQRRRRAKSQREYYQRQKLLKNKLFPKLKQNEKAASQGNIKRRSNRAEYMKEYRQKLKSKNQQYLQAPDTSKHQQQIDKSEMTDFENEIQTSIVDCEQRFAECVVTNVRMYSIFEHELSAMYDRVTGIQISVVDELPKQLCWECVGRLSSANRFVQKALKTHWILLNEVNCGSLITETNINLIDKAQHKLESTLGTKFSNEYDFLFNEENCNIDTSKSDNHSNTKYGMNVELNIFKEEPVFVKPEEVEIGEEQFTVPFIPELPANHIIDLESANDKVERLITGNENANISTEVQSIGFKKEIDNVEVSGANADTSENVIENASMGPNNIFVPHDGESPQRRFICDMCDRVFLHKTTLITHILTHPKMYNCTHCNYKTENISYLNAHINGKHTRSIAYNCSYCNYITFVKRNLQRHAERHFKTPAKAGAKKKKAALKSCTYCNYKTNNKRSLNSHMNAEHTKDIAFDCSFCSYRTYNKGSLTTHVNLEHTRNEIFTCPQCGLETDTEIEHITHIKNAHY